ncbi:MAG: alpha/beta hydrolase family protein [Rubripirellula sp.]|nr:alpha/beta hydrolase family protein [Rubripirellula sp.]
MKTHSEILFQLVLLGLMCNPSAAQTNQADSFAEYPERTSQYLARLHGKGNATHAAEFAFRADFPGGFTAWRQTARAELNDLIGLGKIRDSVGSWTPSVKLDERIRETGYTRQRGEIETEPGVTIPFWLLRPTGETMNPRPLVICAHGHDSDGWNTYAGVYRDADHEAKTLQKDGNPGIQAVRRGYVAIVPATRGLAAATQIPDLKGRHGNRPCRAQLMHCLLAGRTAVGERVWDTQRLLDWALAEVDGIDPSRVAMLGNSGGGVLTVYVAALDERIIAAVPSCSFSSYTSSTGFLFHCDCCLVPHAQVQLGDMTEIGSLAAPRFLLAVHGRQDGLHNLPDVERAMARVQLIYEAANAGDNFRHQWGDSGHKFYPNIMWPFIEASFNR